MAENTPSRKTSGPRTNTRGLRRLSTAFHPLSEDRSAKIARTVQAIIIGAIAAYGAMKPTGHREANVGYTETTSHIRKLQQYSQTNAQELKDMRKALGQSTQYTQEKCRLEVDAIKTYISGYLLALTRVSRIRKPAVETAAKELLNQMVKEKPEAKAKTAFPKERKRPKLSAPAPNLEQLAK